MSRTRASDASILPGLVGAAKAIGHPTRLRILAMLKPGSLCVCQLTAVLGLAASTVSGHLAELRGAGLVVERKSGKWVNYSLAHEGAATALLDTVLAELHADPQRKADAETVRALRTVSREVLCEVGLDLEAVGIARRDRRAAPAHARRRR
jgi:DNA-binding transcriptional ArsR family regulator